MLGREVGEAYDDMYETCTVWCRAAHGVVRRLISDTCVVQVQRTVTWTTAYTDPTHTPSLGSTLGTWLCASLSGNVVVVERMYTCTCHVVIRTASR
jgi:hypothetical protein